MIGNYSRHCICAKNNYMKLDYRLLLISLFFIFSDQISAQVIIHAENFNGGIGSWNAVDQSDATDQWTATAGYMEMNGFGGGNDLDWLISPSINMDAQGNEYFMFDYNDNFAGNLIELWYSANYNGGGTSADVTSGTWIQIQLDVVDFNATSCISNNIFQRHPALDISAITGASVYFAFRYTGLSSSAKTYRIDDIHIEGDYYAGITIGIDCAPLKSELHNLTSAQPDRIRYSSSLYDVWDAILHTDRRRNDANTATIVWDMFTDIPAGTGEFEYDHCSNRDQGSCPGGEGNCYNREHTVPRSWWGGGTALADTQNTDMHHIYPSDRSLNTSKSNYPPGIVTTATTTGSNGVMLGTNGAQPCGINYFEPIDEYKGDYARTYFYFVTRYEHNMVAWAPINARGDCFLDPSTYPSIDPWGLSLMLQWHAADPVSQKEIDRNNAVYAIQGNRNPYIDNPNYVNYVWGNEFGLPCNYILLPISLISFNAEQDKEEVLLSWATSSEQSSDVFAIERSGDDINWHQIGAVEAAGNSASRINYQYSDRYPLIDGGYYRLKQIDLNGEFAYSGVQYIKTNLTKDLHIYPNPFENNITVDGNIDVTTINIYSIQGQDYTGSVSIHRIAENQLKINTEELTSGTYVLQVGAERILVVRK